MKNSNNHNAGEVLKFNAVIPSVHQRKELLYAMEKNGSQLDYA